MVVFGGSFSGCRFRRRPRPVRLSFSLSPCSTGPLSLFCLEEGTDTNRDHFSLPARRPRFTMGWTIALRFSERALGFQVPCISGLCLAGLPMCLFRRCRVYFFVTVFRLFFFNVSFILHGFFSSSYFTCSAECIFSPIPIACLACFLFFFLSLFFSSFFFCCFLTGMSRVSLFVLAWGPSAIPAARERDRERHWHGQKKKPDEKESKTNNRIRTQILSYCVV